MKQWEYKITHEASEHDFNELGADGWELVAAPSSTYSYENSKGEGVDTSTSYIWKRPFYDEEESDFSDDEDF